MLILAASTFLYTTILFIFVSIWGSKENAIVSQLPFGDEALEFFSTTIHGTVEVMPWLQAPLDILIWALYFYVIMTTINIAMWFIHLVRG